MLTAARTSVREARAVGALGSEHPPSARVVLALARFEVKAILLHPYFLAATGLGTLFAARVTGRGNELLLLIFGLAIGIMLGGFLSANQATRRARRDRMGELFASLPSPRESRTIALIVGTLVGPILLSSVVAEIGVLVAKSRFPDEPIGLALAAQIPLAMAGLGALSVALGRWIPSPLTAPVALIAQIATGMIWWLPWIVTPVGGDRLTVQRNLGWHFAYLVSFVVFACAAALLRDRWTFNRAVATAAALGLVIASAIYQVPPGGW